MKILAQLPDEAPFEIQLQIGAPYQVHNDPEEWACPVALTPLFKNLGAAHGGSSFQSLCLASALALGLLQDFRDKSGAALLYEPGEDFEFSSFSFGVASRKS
jgi:hypothetical protein